MNDRMPDEGKAVVVPEDVDPEIQRALEGFDIPVIVSPHAPPGMMFLIDVDALHGLEPASMRTARQVEEVMDRMQRILESDEYRQRFGTIKGID